MTDERPEAAAGVAHVDMSGRTVFVTGSTSGIGRETALAFGRLGAHVLVHGRDKERGVATVERVEETDGSAAFYPADFADSAAVRDLASTVAAEVDSLDVLVNNAGGLFPDSGVTADGIEYHFAVNHLAAFVLTVELAPLLAAADGRVVTVASALHRYGDEPDVPAVRRPAPGSGFRAYCTAKLANVLFTRELARRFDAADGGATANCLHPGVIPENWSEAAPLPLRLATEATSALPAVLIDRFLADTGDGAATPVYLGASPAVADANGEYFADCQRRTPSRLARSDRAARRLWTLSEHLAGTDAALG